MGALAPNYIKLPREEDQLSINFGSSPVRVDELVQAVFSNLPISRRPALRRGSSPM